MIPQQLLDILVELHSFSGVRSLKILWKAFRTVAPLLALSSTSQLYFEKTSMMLKTILKPLLSRAKALMSTRSAAQVLSTPPTITAAASNLRRTGVCNSSASRSDQQTFYP